MSYAVGIDDKPKEKKKKKKAGIGSHRPNYRSDSMSNNAGKPANPPGLGSL